VGGDEFLWEGVEDKGGVSGEGYEAILEDDDEI
jgi:hypothetical protein